MACDEMRPLVYDSLSGELGREEERKLQSHLGSCPACRDYYHRTAAIVEGIRNMEATPPSPEACAEVMEKIEGRHRFGLPFFLARPAYAAAAAALAVMVVSGAVYYQRRDSGIEMDGRASTIAHRPLSGADMERLRKEYLDESDLVLTMVLDISGEGAPYDLGDVKSRIVAKDLLYSGSVLAASGGAVEPVCADINALLLEIMRVRSGADGKAARAIALSIKKSGLIERISGEKLR